jgi:hypothetical protein
MPKELRLDMPAVRGGTTLQRVEEVAGALSTHFLATVKTTALDAKHDAIFGFAAYATSILRELLRVGASTSIVARMALRALLETMITVAYLQKTDSPSMWAEFRAYGIGQAKLAFLKLDDEAAQAVGFVGAEELNAIANEDQSAELVPINIGNWEGTNLRKMSEHAGVKTSYDSYYPWTSAYMHGNWGAVRSTSFDLCLNALHRAHRVLRGSPTSLNDVVLDACEMVDRILDAVDATFPSFTPRVTVKPSA